MHRSQSGARVMLRLLTAALLVAIPTMAQALGLGRLTVQSALDEPLVGQIDLIDPSPQDLKSLKASLASREEFDIAGIERTPNLFDIKYTVSQHPNGQYYLKLSSDKSIREPFLHFLVQVEWSGGRLIREYSALLDPPHWVAGAPADVDVPAAGTSEPLASAETVAPAATEVAPPVAAAQSSESAPAPVAASPSEAAEAEKAQLAASTPVPMPAAAEPESAAETSAAAPEAQPTTAVSSAEAAPATETAAAAAPTESATPAESSGDGMAPAIAAEAPAVAPATIPVQVYGPVKPGDTLSHVAGRVGADTSLTPQQVMIALLRANPSAFYKNNVNILKTGKILKVPEREAIAAIPKAQAAQEFRAQYDAWQEYKLKLAGSSRAVAVAEADDATKPAAQTGAKKTDGKKADKVAPGTKADKTGGAAKAQPVDLLKIVRANLEQDTNEDTTKTPGVETKKEAGKDKTVLTDRVATLEEAIESKQMQNKDMRERVGKLQEQVKNTERLIDLENKDLAKSQKQAAEKQAADAKLADAKAAQEKAAQEKAAQEKAAQEKAAQEKAAQEKAAQEKAAQEKAAAAAAVAVQRKPEAGKAIVPPKPTPVVPAQKPKVRAPAPAPQESFLDSLLSGLTGNPLVMAMLAGVGVLAAGVGGVYAYRRRRASREFSESILSGSSLTNETSITDPSGQAASSDTSFLSDFSQGGMGNIHTDEVDPIAEAEVYLAYGRDEQAEEILKDAIVKDPVRQELKGKLLEIYFQRNDTPAFETLAEELYAALEGKGGKVWDKVEEMGRKLNPGNPMFSGGKPAARAAKAAPAATTMLMAETASTAEAAPAQAATESHLATQTLEFQSSSATAGSDLDFNMNFESEPTKNAPGLDMAFDLDSSAAPESASEANPSGLDMEFGVGASARTEDTSSNLIDFSLPSMPEDTTGSAGNLDFTLDEEAPAASGNSIDFSSSMSDLSLGLGDTGEIALETASSDDAVAEASPAGWDETATKLDLAKAYIDMGDAEGARSILDEVMAEGNESQKKQARDLAAQIAA
jgi:pilus assembly protein FimV